MGDNAALLLRVGFSFSLVLGLMWVAARVLRSRTAGRPTDTVEVLARTQLGRGSSVTVLRVGEQALVLGVTEKTISLLGDPIADLAALTPAPGRAPVAVPVSVPALASAAAPGPAEKNVIPSHRAAPSAPQAMAGQGALAGSILSPATWRLGMDALRERTVRRG